MLVGVGVNPIHNPIAKTLWALIGLMSATINVRDRLSYDSVRKCLPGSLKNKVKECVDMVLSIDVGPISSHAARDWGARQTIFGEKTVCLVSVASPWSKEEVQANPDRLERFLSSMVSISKAVIDNGDFPIFVPFYLPDDVEIAQEIVRRLPVGAAYVETSSSACVRIHWFNQVQYVIAMRFHALVLSGCFEKPAYTIAYDHKLESLAKLLGSDGFISKIGIRATEFFGRSFDLEIDDTLNKFSAFLSQQPEQRAVVHRRMRDLREAANENFSFK
jgi:polysaccharide pyruvyl transferase WcaK-like protein